MRIRKKNDMAATAAHTKNATTSVKEHDYLKQDPPLRGQNYVCLSFVSPEDVIERKEASFFREFMSNFSGDMTNMFDSLAQRFYNDAQVVDMLKGLKMVHDNVFDGKRITAQYDHFVTQNRDRLEKEYYEANNFQTSIRGIKVRGSYETLHDAQERAKSIQKFDAMHNVFVAEIGCWCPWSPHAADLDKQEYMETHLNTLVKGYEESRAVANTEFDSEVKNTLFQGGGEGAAGGQRVTMTVSE